MAELDVEGLKAKLQADVAAEIAALEERKRMATVWLAICGCYSSQYVEGVYSSAEKAMAAHPIRPDMRPIQYHEGAKVRPLAWTEDEDGNWHNGADWEDSVSVERYEVDRGV